MAIEIVDFPIKNGGSFHSYVSLSEANQLENAIGRLFDIDGDGMISEDDLKSVIPDASCHDTLWLCQNSY